MTQSLSSQPVVETLEPRMLLSVAWAGSWAINGYLNQTDTNNGQAYADSSPLVTGFTISNQGGDNFLLTVPKYGVQFNVQAVGDELHGYTAGNDRDNDYKQQYVRVISITDNAALFIMGEGGFDDASMNALKWTTGVAGLMTRGTVIPTNRPWAGDYVSYGYDMDVRSGWPGTVEIETNSRSIHVADLGGGQYSAQPEGDPQPYLFVTSGKGLLHQTAGPEGDHYDQTSAHVFRGPADTLYVIDAGADFNLSQTAIEGSWISGMILTPAIGSEYKPDLTVELLGPGAQVTPGEKVSVPVKITNSGAAPAVGKALVNLWTPASDTDPATTVLQSLNLAPGASVTRLMTFTVPLDAPAGDCTIRADVDFANVIDELDETNNSVEDADYASVVWSFGAVDGKMGHKLTLPDADGTLVTFSMTGPGTGTVTSDANGWAISVENTTAASGIMIQTRATGSDDGKTELASVSSATPLKSITGKTTDLTGPIELTSASLTTVSFTFADISGGAIHSAMPVLAVTANSWQDSLGGDLDADLEAPAIGKITVKGNFDADLATPGSLGNVTIGGSVAQSLFDVGGSIGKIAVTGDFSDSIVRSGLDILGFSARSVSGSDFGAGVSTNLLKADRHVAVGDAANSPTGTIKAFAVKGNKAAAGDDFFSDSYISARIGSLAMVNWDGAGGLFAPAGTVKSVKNVDWRDASASWKYPVKAGQPTDGPDAFINII